MEYYYGQEADMFTFYRLPKILFTDPRYKTLSTDAKVLYGLMLDRMGLSLKNHKQDEQGRTYIFFRQEEAMEMLTIGKDKAIKLYRELEKIGLIERKRQGLTHPDIIYVGRLTAIPDVPRDGKAAVKKSEKPPSRSRKNRVQESGKTEFIPTNENEKSHTYMNQSIYHREVGGTTDTPAAAEEILDNDEYVQMFKLYICYEAFQKGLYGKRLMKPIDELVALMADECSSRKPTIRVGGADLPRADFRRRLMTISDTSIERILYKLENPDPDKPISNRRAYLITMLYNHQTTDPTPDEDAL